MLPADKAEYYSTYKAKVSFHRKVVNNSGVARRTDRYARRKPVQDRSKSRREAILRAGTRVLARYGYEEATTARIAKAAKIPVGSLYEYFPNREAVFRTLLESELRKVMENVLRLASQQQGRTPEEALGSLVGVAVESISANRRTLGTLITHMPGVLGLPVFLQLEPSVRDLARAVAWISPGDAGSGDFALKIHILTNAVFGYLIRLATLPDPGIPPERITAELVKLLAGYLETDG